jgi:hypothetical protein
LAEYEPREFAEWDPGLRPFSLLSCRCSFSHGWLSVGVSMCAISETVYSHILIAAEIRMKDFGGFWEIGERALFIDGGICR